MIACPRCGNDRISAHDAYGPDFPRIHAICQECWEDVDVKIVDGEVKLGLVTYHPGLPWHDADDPCPMCLGEWPATPHQWVEQGQQCPNCGTVDQLTQTEPYGLLTCQTCGRRFKLEFTDNGAHVLEASS